MPARIPGSTDIPERWQSGRMYLTRNQAYVRTYRGFESLPLLQNKSNFSVPTGRFQGPLTRGFFVGVDRKIVVP